MQFPGFDSIQRGRTDSNSSARSPAKNIEDKGTGELKKIPAKTLKSGSVQGKSGTKAQLGQFVRDLKISLGIIKRAPPRPQSQPLHTPMSMIRKLELAKEMAEKTGDTQSLKVATKEARELLQMLSHTDSNEIDRAKLALKTEECEFLKTELSPKRQVYNMLMKEIAGTNKELADELSANLRQHVDHNMKQMKMDPTHQFSVFKAKYVVTQDPQNPAGSRIPTIWRRDSKYFATGGMAEIYGGRTVGGTDRYAMKVLKEDKKDHKAHIDDMKNEVKVAADVHKNGRVPGVVPTPRLVKFGLQEGVLMPRQDSDGWKLGESYPCTKFSSAEIKKILSTAVDGLNAIHATGYYHGDVKGGNLLWNKDTQTLMVGDLGGARKFDELFPLNQFPTIRDIIGIHSPPYVSPQIVSAIQDRLAGMEKLYTEEQDPGRKVILLKTLMRDIKPLLIANDRYAMGLALIDSLIPAWNLDFRRLTKGELETELKEGNVPADVRKTIFSLMDTSKVVYRSR